MPSKSGRPVDFIEMYGVFYSKHFFNAFFLLRHHHEACKLIICQSKVYFNDNKILLTHKKHRSPKTYSKIGDFKNSKISLAPKFMAIPKFFSKNNIFIISLAPIFDPKKSVDHNYLLVWP